MKLCISRLPLLAVIFVLRKGSECGAVYDCRICAHFDVKTKCCMATRIDKFGHGIKLNGYHLNPENRRWGTASICDSYKPERRTRLI